MMEEELTRLRKDNQLLRQDKEKNMVEIKRLKDENGWLRKGKNNLIKSWTGKMRKFTAWK